MTLFCLFLQLKIAVMVDTEALRRKYSPEGSALRELQDKMLEEVLFLDKVCKENGLTYFLSGGSALGAVRHQGFIPWDDDMDIALPSPDFNKLVKILHSMDTGPYVLHDCHSDFNYVHLFPKFRLKEGNLLSSFPPRGRLYKYKGVGIDIFSLEPNSYARSLVCGKLRVFLLHYTYLIKNETLRKWVTKVQWAVFRCLVPLTWPLNVSRKKGEMHYGLGQGIPQHSMREQELFPVVEMPFESAQLPVPCNQDAYLTHLYGNWRQVPSEEEIMDSIHNKELMKS